MMNFEEVSTAVEMPDFEAIEQAHQQFMQMEPQERAKAFREAVEAFRQGLTQEEIEAIAEAINYKNILPFDESEWEFAASDDEDRK